MTASASGARAGSGTGSVGCGGGGAGVCVRCDDDDDRTRVRGEVWRGGGEGRMNCYRRFYSQFWTGTTGKELRSAGQEVQLMAVYLFTNPHANMIGLYYLPIGYISLDTGLE